MFGSPDIQMDVDLTCFNGAEGVRRCCGGESCVKLLITNKASQEGVRTRPVEGMLSIFSVVVQ